MSVLDPSLADLADLRWCPRCGLESWSVEADRCPACGLSGGVEAGGELTITIVARGGEEPPAGLAPRVVWTERLTAAAPAGVGQSAGCYEHYACFRLGEVGDLLATLAPDLDYRVLLNGRPRPFARDLWLPLFQFFAPTRP